MYKPFILKKLENKKSFLLVVKIEVDKIVQINIKIWKNGEPW